jgi:pseudouridine synthase
MPPRPGSGRRPDPRKKKPAPPARKAGAKGASRDKPAKAPPVEEPKPTKHTPKQAKGKKPLSAKPGGAKKRGGRPRAHPLEGMDGRDEIVSRLRDASRPGAVRIQRFMADAGVASRRACEALLEEGRVLVNGVKLTELPIFVVPGEDRIEVDGEPLRVNMPERPTKGKAARTTKTVAGERLIYVMLNKPRNTVTTVYDPDGRRTVNDLVEHPSGARLYPVGRLDYDTMGLVLMTNDGDLANRLTHPRYGVHKTYRAVVKGRIEDDAIEELEQGVYLAQRQEGRTVGAKRTAHVQMRVVKRDETRTMLELTLEEGRNRQVRRMLAKVGHPVKKLTRVGMGPLKLTKVAMGEWRELTRDEVSRLKKAAGGSDPLPPSGRGRGGSSSA